MAHYSRLHAIVLDVPADDHAATVAFWEGALGQAVPRVEKYPEFHGTLLEHQRMLFLAQRLGEGGPRVHLDIHTDDLVAEVARLEALGATRVEGAGPWQVMRDPSGQVFCVVADKPGTLNDENARRWE
ncbi:VOC family protein [Dactylosporangium sp. AC04546]|uniref:VOC family protein n=1 Tax=Dactylosporangium sp. AC04546 TaxID=2862460 RepID=UPI001EDEEB67|nr:VOC family protein [Dactylosporangium sp. AC04546]WVK87618.1 VOC family protein [Dactylosporangium sp. AC04546]